MGELQTAKERIPMHGNALLGNEAAEGNWLNGVDS